MSGISLICDTNPLVYLLDGNEDVGNFLDGKQVWISFISELELFGKKGLNEVEKREINNLINSCFIADMNLQIKQSTKDLMQKNHIKLPDAIIAATAQYLDLPLFTADTGFKTVPNLKLVILEL